MTDEQMRAFEIQVEAGDHATPYQPYSDSNVELTAKLSQFGTTVNFEENKTIIGGNIQNSSVYLVTDYIEVTPNASYTIKCGISNTAGVDFVMYDANKQFVSNPSMYDRTFTAPNNVKYLRLTLKKDYRVTGGVYDSNGKCIYTPCRVGAEHEAKVTEDLANKFAVVSGTTSSTSASADVTVAYPSGFNYNNCVVISAEINNASTDYCWGDTSNNIVVSRRSSSLIVFSRSSAMTNKKFNIVLMRTDI